MFLSSFYFSVVFVLFCVFLKNNIYLTNDHNVHALSVTRKQKKEATTAFFSMLREICFTITKFCDFTFTQHYKKRGKNSQIRYTSTMYKELVCGKWLYNNKTFVLKTKEAC